MSRLLPRGRWLAIGALVLLLAVAPFVPRGGGDDDDGAITPSGRQGYAARSAAAVGLGPLTPDAAAEIDRVLATPAHARATGAARCADFEGLRYCLGTGWTDDTPAQVQARTVLARRAATERTGDLDAAALLRRTHHDRAARAELTAAARSVAKVWLLRHELQGVPLPAGFLERHPEARAITPTTARTTARTAAKAYPDRAVVLKPSQVTAQETTYWCGPTTMQMIGWGWKGTPLSQSEWARRLGTTTSGTGITDMVRVVNGSTGWDGEDHAGPYVVLDIGDWTFGQWSQLIKRHVADYRAPVVMHPVLRTQFFPYLDDDASGHFQVGRGYAKKPGKPLQVSYFEPWDQQRFDPSEPAIERVQWRSAYKSYRANLAHFQHNIGV
jgi:hypothetical protein